MLHISARGKAIRIESGDLRSGQMVYQYDRKRHSHFTCGHSTDFVSRSRQDIAPWQEIVYGHMPIKDRGRNQCAVAESSPSGYDFLRTTQLSTLYQRSLWTENTILRAQVTENRFGHRYYQGLIWFCRDKRWEDSCLRISAETGHSQETRLLQQR